MRIIDPKPQGVADWTLCIAVLAMAVPVVVVFGPLVWIIRACDHVGGKAVSHAK